MKQTRPVSFLRSPADIGFIYVVFSCLWILFAAPLARIILTPDTARHWGTLEKLFYLGISNVFVYLILRRLSKLNHNLESALALQAATLIQSHEKIRQAESLMTNIPGVAWTSAVNGWTTYISPNVETVFGYTADEMSANREALWFGKIHPNDKQRVIAAFEALFAEGRPFDQQYQVRRKDDSCIWVHDRAFRTYEKDGVRLADGVCCDITERKFAEETLRRKEERLLLATEAADLGTWDWDIVNDRMAWSPRCYKLLGIQTGTLLNHERFLAAIHPEDRDQITAAVRNCLDGQSDHLLELRIRWPDGSIHWLTARGHTHYDASNRPLRMRGVVQEITQHKLAESALRKSEERFKLAARASRDVIWDWDIVNDQVWYSDRFWQIFGYDEATFPRTAQGWADLVHPDDAWVLSPQFDKYTNNEYRMRRADGTWAHILDRAYLICDAENNRIRKIGVFSDISEAKLAEQALRESEARYRLLFERNLAGVFRSNSDGKLLHCNEAACRILGYRSLAEMHELDIRSLYYNSADRETAMASLRKRGQLLNYQIQLRRKDGAAITVLANVSATPQTAGQPLIIDGTMIDVTEIGKLQDQLAQARKMEAIGKLAGGVAHDFNNLLMVMSSYSELALDRVVDTRAKQHVERVLDAIRRAADLTRQLLAFSRNQVIEPRILDLNMVVRDMQKILARLVREDIAFELTLEQDLHHVKADPTQVQQVLMNLVVNARDAMPHGGRLLIATKNVQLESSDPCSDPAVPPGSYVTLAVGDTGLGMDLETQQRIFEPFFTTKELGQGTGLGLSTVFGIVKQNGGYIFVHSAIGCGTTLKIYLPSNQGPLPPSVEVLQPDRFAGSATVLLVEDEVSLREAGAEFLRSRGYNVILACDGEDALQTAREFRDTIDVLVTDIVMPGLNGTLLAERVRLLRPGLKVLFMSGYTDSTYFHDSSESSRMYLQKPFSFQSLANKLFEILSGSNHAAATQLSGEPVPPTTD